MKRSLILYVIPFTMILTPLFFAGCEKQEKASETPSAARAGHEGHAGEEARVKLYVCPMEDYEGPMTEDGRCPNCGMKLVPKEPEAEKPESRARKDAKSREKHAKKKAGPTLYHCPMHPTYTADRPGECPICGMTLVPIEDEDTGEIKVEGQARVKLNARRRQFIGVKTGPVEYKVMHKVIRTVGRIAYDPELYKTQEEYLAAHSAYKRVRGSAIAEAVKRSASLLESSHLRLRLLGLSDNQIDELAVQGKPDIGLLISSGKGGSLWLYADVYEYEMSMIKTGQPVETTTLSLPGHVFRGRIKAIDPTINPRTRSARIRVLIPDPKGLLRPDTFMNVRIHIPLGKRLVVPEEAVIDTGIRKIVFVDEGEGYFDPREVVLGVKSENYFEVRSGLKDGEKVVTSGNFLIDSESKLKAAIAAIAGGHQH